MRVGLSDLEDLARRLIAVGLLAEGLLEQRVLPVVPGHLLDAGLRPLAQGRSGLDLVEADDAGSGIAELDQQPELELLTGSEIGRLGLEPTRSRLAVKDLAALIF